MSPHNLAKWASWRPWRAWAFKTSSPKSIIMCTSLTCLPRLHLFSKYWVLIRCFPGADPPSHQDGRAGGQADGRGNWKDSARKLFGNVPGESADQINYWNSFSEPKPWVNNWKQFSSWKCSQVTREMIKAEAEAQWKSYVIKAGFTLNICGAEPLNGLEDTWILPVIPVFFLPFILK